MPTLYYDSSGDCYDAPSGGNLVLRYDFESAASTVQLTLEKTASTVPDLSRSLTAETKVPSTHPGNASWSPSGGGSTVTITFDVPTTPGAEWGWDYQRSTLPTPLKIKVRIKPPPP